MFHNFILLNGTFSVDYIELLIELTVEVLVVRSKVCGNYTLPDPNFSKLL